MDSQSSDTQLIDTSSAIVNTINGLMTGSLTVQDTEALDMFSKKEMSTWDSVIAMLVKKSKVYDYKLCVLQQLTFLQHTLCVSLKHIIKSL
ncbi:hypothetical protein VNI00_004660 [Paramarasmius palmivorus]|uniref:Uncharacterized protein n=1 Tax=Paramarasmius palmivorus TaxID=297713 RepID=A0AAW0B2M0_9AGAR